MKRPSRPSTPRATARTRRVAARAGGAARGQAASRGRAVSRRAASTTRSRGYDRRAAERYWGSERQRLRDEFRIVLSAGEPAFVNAAYHTWEVATLVRALAPGPDVRVLDLACGLGRVSVPLALAGATVVGVDNALSMAQAAKGRTVEASQSERSTTRASYVQGFSGQLPFADRSFDAVLCLGLLEHLPSWLQESTLAEVLRVLRPGGSLYLVLNNDRSLLLRAGRDNRYRQARQLPNGYYCGLVDRHRLVGDLADGGAAVSVLGSNGHYAVLRHALHGREMRRAEAQEASRAFAAAADRDLEEPHQNEFGETCADHFFYRIERR